MAFYSIHSVEYLHFHRVGTYIIRSSSSSPPPPNHVLPFFPPAVVSGQNNLVSWADLSEKKMCIEVGGGSLGGSHHNFAQQLRHCPTNLDPLWQKQRSCVLIAACCCESTTVFVRLPISLLLPREETVQLCKARGWLTERERGRERDAWLTLPKLRKDECKQHLLFLCLCRRVKTELPSVPKTKDIISVFITVF